MIAEEIGKSYKEANDSWEKRANTKFSYTASDTIALAGFGCGLKVEKNALVCKQGFTHTSQVNTSQTLYRGVHGIKSIIILSDSGNITLDAIRWCNEQNISVSIIDRDGSLLQTLTPEHPPRS